MSLHVVCKIILEGFNLAVPTPTSKLPNLIPHQIFQLYSIPFALCHEYEGSWIWRSRVLCFLTYYFTLSSITVWSESTPFVGSPGYVCFHPNICHTHSGVSGGGGREYSCGIHCGGVHLLLHVFLCIRMGVSQVLNCREANVTLVLCHMMQAGDVGCEYGEMHSLEVRGTPERGQLNL